MEFKFVVRICMILALMTATIIIIPGIVVCCCYC